MKTLYIFLLAVFYCIYGIHAASGSANEPKPMWQSKLNSLKVFIENKGQFTLPEVSSNEILYGYVGSIEKYYFTKSGVIIRLDKFTIKKNLVTFIKDIFSKENKEEEKENLKGESYFITANWQNSNQDVTIDAEGKSESYYTFNKDPYQVYGFKKLIYRNIYPGIDIEYIIPSDSSGVKYSLIVHPGADVSQIKLKYSGDVTDILLDESGNLSIKTPAWDLMEHVPFSHYAGENQEIKSNFSLDKDIISFIFPSGIDGNKQLVIDPWMSGIAISTNDIGYDVDYDYNGNLYAFIRPIGNTVIYVNKYSPTGTVLWSHLSTYDFSAYEGNFVVEKNTERVYIGEGYNGSGALLYRLGSNGAADGFVSQQNPNYREIWDLAFDCNSNNSIIAVGGGTAGNSNGGRVDFNTGAVSVANFTNIAGTCQDIVSYAIDNQSNLFVVYAKSSDVNSVAVDDKIELVNSTLTGPVWMVPSGMYGFSEVSNHWPTLTTFSSTSNGFNALTVNDNYLFYYDGGGLAAYNTTNGSQLAATSVGLAGTWYTPVNQGGVAADDCDNVYVGGSSNNLLMYTFNGAAFTQAGSMPLGWATNDQVFDVKYDRNTNLIFVAGGNNVGVYTAPLSTACNLLTDTSFCSGPNSGTASVTLNTQAVNPAITYVWQDLLGTVIDQTLNSSLLTNTVTSLANGTYVVSVQINAPCGPMFTDTVIIDCPSCAATVTTTPVSCFGGNNGTASVTPSGGTGPYTYVWSPAPGSGQGTPNISGLTATTYNVTVTDANLCPATANGIVSQPTAVVATVPNSTNILCFGGSNGTATASASGGTGTYTYLWNDPAPVQTSVTATNLTFGTWTVQVTDANSCSTTASVSLTEPALLSVTIPTQTNISCNGGSDGTATAAAVGGTGAYIYLWNDPAPAQTTITATSLTSGTWTVQVTDANSCTATASVIIIQPALLMVGISAQTNVSCNGGSDGSLTASGFGGTQPYSFLWSDAQPTATATGLSIGPYSVTITDALNCTATINATITQQSPLNLSITHSDVLCSGTSSGAANLSVSGGALPYASFAWSNAGNTEDLSSIAAGQYCVTVTDANGCTDTACVIISEPTLLTASINTLTDISCNGGNDGAASITVAGGTTPYSYTWAANPLVNSNSVTNIGAGNSSVSVTDANGCLAVVDFSLSEPLALTITTSPNVTICSGGSTTMAVTASGGTMPYFYFWNNQPGMSSWLVSPTTTTSYLTNVVDANGCFSPTATINITVLPPVGVTATSLIDSLCPGDSTQIFISAFNGNGGPYTLTIPDGTVITTPYMVTPQTSQQYIFTATDGCNSSATASITIYLYPVPPVNIIADKYSGCPPLRVQFNETSLNAGQSYFWNFDSPDENNLSFAKNPVHIFDVPGTYDVSQTITSINGCKSHLTVPDMIVVFPMPEARFTYNPINPTILNPRIEFTNLSSNYVSNYWSFGDGDSSLMVNPDHLYRHVGYYPVSLIAITDKGCRDTVIEIIKINDVFTFYAPTAFSPDNDGKNDFFFVYASGIDETSFHIYMYDRWGELIFEADDTHKGWDGKVSGKMSQVGTYTWMAVFKDFLGNQKTQAGKVTLIR